MYKVVMNIDDTHLTSNWRFNAPKSVLFFLCNCLLFFSVYPWIYLIFSSLPSLPFSSFFSLSYLGSVQEKAYLDASNVAQKVLSAELSNFEELMVPVDFKRNIPAEYNSLPRLTGATQDFSICSLLLCSLLFSSPLHCCFWCTFSTALFSALLGTD